MAPKKRRRPTAGPPPVRNPRYEAKVAPSTERAPGPPAGAPRPKTLRELAIPAVFAAAVLGIFVYFSEDRRPGNAITVALIGLVFMIGLGYAMDRALQRARMRRWQKRQGDG